MQRATKDELYFEIGSDNKPALHIKPGELFEVETQITAGYGSMGIRAGKPSRRKSGEQIL